MGWGNRLNIGIATRGTLQAQGLWLGLIGTQQECREGGNMWQLRTGLHLEFFKNIKTYTTEIPQQDSQYLSIDVFLAKFGVLPTRPRPLLPVPSADGFLPAFEQEVQPLGYPICMPSILHIQRQPLQ